MITHVLDTSALLAHYLREPGAEDVNIILARGPEETGISLITVVELRGRGLTVQEIATALGVSRRTAFRYLATAPAS